MKELNVYDTLIQNEALINELKGNLFEFLVAKEIASESGVEGQFLTSIPADFHERLRGYEQWLRDNAPGLLIKLPLLSTRAASFLGKNLKAPFAGVLLVGKITGNSHDELLKEADLLLKKGPVVLPVSLKLCKDNSFVNTKSAGARSFFSKYFAGFSEVEASQEILNEKLDKSFLELTKELHLMAGIEQQEKFGELWRSSGLPELPGQLEAPMSAVLKEHHHQMINSFYEVWDKLLRSDPDTFYDCMMPLLGFGNKEVSQYTCFYKGDYNLSNQMFKTRHTYRKQLRNSILQPPKKGLSSFEMLLDDCIFQVRLKPMNKFTVSGLKVNCSLKQLKS